jgi:hypothetical protein
MAGAGRKTFPGAGDSRKRPGAAYPRYASRGDRAKIRCREMFAKRREPLPCEEGQFNEQRQRPLVSRKTGQALPDGTSLRAAKGKKAEKNEKWWS